MASQVNLSAERFRHCERPPSPSSGTRTPTIALSFRTIYNCEKSMRAERKEGFEGGVGLRLSCRTAPLREAPRESPPQSASAPLLRHPRRGAGVIAAGPKPKE